MFGDFPSNDGAGAWGTLTGKEKASALRGRQPVVAESAALHSWREQPKTGLPKKQGNWEGLCGNELLALSKTGSSGGRFHSHKQQGS